MTHTLGDGPVEDRYRAQMHAIMDAINEFVNPEERKTAIVIMMFPFVEFEKGDSRCNFMSNGVNREDLTVLMKEMIARFEGQAEAKGRA